MLGWEIEKVGIPVVQITAVPSAAIMVGIHRVLVGNKITNPYGDHTLDPEAEKELRRKYIRRAMELLQKDVSEATQFTLGD